MAELLEVGALLPDDLVNGWTKKHWRVPEWAFRPDAWTSAFLRGLGQLQIQKTESIWEVGVGTGLVSFFLRTRFPGLELFFSDFDPRCTELAVDNLRDGRCSAADLIHCTDPGIWSIMNA